MCLLYPNVSMVTTATRTGFSFIRPQHVSKNEALYLTVYLQALISFSHYFWTSFSRCRSSQITADVFCVCVCVWTGRWQCNYYPECIKGGHFGFRGCECYSVSCVFILFYFFLSCSLVVKYEAFCRVQCYKFIRLGVKEFLKGLF